MKSIFSKIFKFKNSYLIAVVLFFVFFAVSPVKAELGIPENVGAFGAAASGCKSAAEAIAYCNNIGSIECTGPECIGTLNNSLLAKCIENVTKDNACLQIDSQWKEYAAKVAAEAKKAARQEALATTFKNSLNLFARTIAHDSAVWVASGGKGQKPLFITEGWGPYLKNVGDSALGDFIDGIGQTFGMDLCQPNFQVKLAIKAGLDYTQQRQVRCSFSKIMTNWQSAINNANFAFEYKESLRPGENDVSFQLIMADQRNQYIADKKLTAEKTADTNSLWKDITNVAGNILTPGTFIANQFRQDQAKADIGMATFTNTIADVVEEFLNTLVSQLLKNLQAGFFSSTPIDNSGTLDLKPLLALFNPNSSPISVINGTVGAKAKFGGLLSSDNYKIGGKYDLLVKLATCSDDAKNNPGPTDCVLDQGLVSAIKSMSYVNDLPQDIKNRVFAPQSDLGRTLSDSISYRSILIMRTYSIVPVGWEVAAEIANKNAKTITLGEVMAKFNVQGDPYYRLIDPYWTLKLPELYCRRTGYGEQNSGIKDQSSSINRNEYCSDPNQCLKEDASGNCLNYGYCEEDEPIWRLGKECEPKYNTCNTFTSRSNVVSNWLANTLDYSNCSANNVGCRSYATNYNYQSKMWNGDKIIEGSVTRLSSNLSAETITVDARDPRWHVLQDHSISVNGRLDLGTICNKNNCSKITGCVWDDAGKTCVMAGANSSCSAALPPGGISCAVESCYSNTNELSALNPDFELQESSLNTGNAKSWTDELSFSDINNRHYRASGVGVSGFGLKAVSANNSTELITSLPPITLLAGKTYKLKFSIRGTITNGSIRVGIRDGNNPYAEGADNTNIGQSFVTSIANWTTIELPFVNSQNFAEGRVVIITPINSIIDVSLDNFSLQQMTEACSAGSVRLFTAPTDETDNIFASNIYFDRDAETCGASSAGCSQFVRVNTSRIASEFSEDQIPALDYASKEYAYLKKAPDYYSCYKNVGGAWPSNAFELDNVLAQQASECNSYAKVCIKSEVGCELYTPINGDPQIPGIVDNLDLCPSECSGYQVYKQEATNFIANSSYKQFIADKNAKYCSAAYAGCDEFTNLDELGRGAEKKEYYVSFKACQRPSTDDASYYTWEGSDTTGYQLKSYILKKSRVLDPQSNLGYAPCTDLTYPNVDGSNYCNDVLTDGFCARDDMAGNADCRELYDTAGNIHYRLLSKTVSVSDNCHPYRRTQTQTTVAAAETDCTGSHGWWKTATSECIYMAIPQEGRTCSAAVAGCRAYTGNRGNNVRNILSSSDFTSATTSDNLWEDQNGGKDGLMISSEATYPGGNSLSNKSGNNIIKHPANLTKNRTYILSFWAKGDQSFSPANVSLSYNNGAKKDDFSAASLSGENLQSPRIMITTDWKRYDLGPVFITEDNLSDSYLIFNLPIDQKIYLDNIILKELSNNIYAIENSWYTPVSCDNKLDDSEGKASVAADTCVNPLTAETGRCSPGEMLGCTAYKDRANTVWYLRSFNALCRKEAAGCEALIDTHNSESKNAESFNTELPNYDDVTVPADNLVYLVNDPKTSCASADKGCTALGLPIIDKWDAVVGYQTVYKKNNPTRYGTDLCKHSELWCEEYAGNNSFNYFKDPHGKNCEYNTASSTWFKIGTNQPCDTTLSQTYGTGNIEAKRQPIGAFAPSYNGWVGVCATGQATCSEYVDPLPYMYSGIRSSTNLTYNLKANNLYVFEAGNNIVTISPAFPCSVEMKSASTFYLSNNPESAGYCVVTVPASVTKIAQAGVYYSLQSSVNYSGCNGQADFRNGCVLFNDRSQRNLSTSTVSGQNKYLNYNALQTYADNMTASVIGGEFSDSAKPVPPAMGVSGSSADTSRIIKVKADRQCDKWLYCNSYAKKDPASTVAKYEEGDRCFSLGTCSSFDASGNCSTVETEVLTAPAKYDYNRDKNKTGYAKIGSNNASFYPYSAMNQIGGSAPLANGNFEYTFGDKGEPLGWSLANSVVNWESFMYEIKNDPANAPEGSSYMALKGKHGDNEGLISEEIDVIKNAQYSLSYWVNTSGLTEEDSYSRLRIINGVKLDSNSSDFNQLSSSTVPAGMGWQRVILTFKPAVSKIYVQLSNSNIPDATFSGQTLWDDIQIKPLLDVNDQANTDIARTCRAYPETSSRSCQYSGADKFYYGQYGYCMLNDPKNPKQCLQWWPVDEIKGELVEQYSGYQDMRPLYYCVESQPIKIKLTNLSTDTRVDTNNLNDKYKSLADLDTGKAMRFVPFTNVQVPDAYRALFRFPFIGKFDFNGFIVAIGGINSGNTSGIGWRLRAKMYKDAVLINGASFKSNPSTLPGLPESCNGIINTSSPEPADSQAERFLANGAGEEYCTKLFANDKIDLSCEYSSGCAVYDNNSSKGSTVYTKLNEYNLGESTACCEGNTISTNGDNQSCYINKWITESFDTDCQLLMGCRQGMKARIASSVIDSNGYYSMDHGICEAYCDKVFSDLSSESWCPDLSDRNLTGGGTNWSGSIACGSEIEACKSICNNAGHGIVDSSHTGGTEAFYNADVLPILNQWQQDQFEGDNKTIVGKIFSFLSGFGAIVKGMLSGNGEPKFIPDKDSWGGWGIEGFHVNKLPIVYVLPWHLTMANTEGLSGLATSIYSLAETILKIVGVKLPDFGMANGGVRIITDQDVGFGGSSADPVPGLPGDILGFVHYLDYQGTFINGLNMTGVLSSEFTVNYCSKFVKVVTAVGVNKAWLDRINPNSSFVLDEADALNNHSYFKYSDPFDFDALVSDIGKCAGVMNDNPLGDRTNYTASDWKPFGAIVAPANSSNEVTWDSKPDIAYRQPLFLEPPLTNLSEPYQSRAGSIHDASALKQLFIKSYGAWKWQDNGIVQKKLVPPSATNSECITSAFKCTNLAINYMASRNATIAEFKDYTSDNDCKIFVDNCMSKGSVLSCAIMGANCALGVADCVAGSATVAECRDQLPLCKNFIDTCITPDDSSNDTYLKLDKSSDPAGYDEYNWDLLSTWGDDGGYCPNTIRGVSEICRVRPVFSDVTAEPTDNNETLVRLQFNVKIDANQLPITSYVINWGDSNDVVTGVSLKQRISTSSPFRFYHNYNFDKLKQNDSGSDDIVCGTSVIDSREQCQVKIRINVKDNWNAQQDDIAMVMVRKQ